MLLLHKWRLLKLFWPLFQIFCCLLLMRQFALNLILFLLKSMIFFLNSSSENWVLSFFFCLLFIEPWNFLFLLVNLWIKFLLNLLRIINSKFAFNIDLSNWLSLMENFYEIVNFAFLNELWNIKCSFSDYCVCCGTRIKTLKPNFFFVISYFDIKHLVPFWF